jgi:hypothetical protein
LCPPLTKRKAGRPRVSRFKAWFEKGGSSKKEKKMKNRKGPKKVTKIDASFARNLGTKLGLPYAVTLLKEQSMSFYYYCFVDFFTY